MKSIDDPFESPSGYSDEEAIALAIARDAELESGAVKPLSHADLMKRLRA